MTCSNALSAAGSDTAPKNPVHERREAGDCKNYATTACVVSNLMCLNYYTSSQACTTREGYWAGAVRPVRSQQRDKRLTDGVGEQHIHTASHGRHQHRCAHTDAHRLPTIRQVPMALLEGSKLARLQMPQHAAPTGCAKAAAPTSSLVALVTKPEDAPAAMCATHRDTCIQLLRLMQ